MSKRNTMFVFFMLISVILTAMIYLTIGFIEMAILAWIISVLFNVAFSFVSVFKITIVFTVVATFVFLPKTYFIVRGSVNKRFPKE